MKIAEFDAAALADFERAAHAALLEAHGRDTVDRLFRTIVATVKRLRSDMGGKDIARELGLVVHAALVEAGVDCAAYARRSIVGREMVRQAVELTRYRFTTPAPPVAPAADDDD